MPLTLEQLQSLDDLLQTALDLPHAARASWIDALPAPHNALAPLLRAHLLAKDIVGQEETADFMGALPTIPALAAQRNDPLPGERIGPYVLVRALGEGGMSSVWLAERADGTLKREVALKLPHRHLLDRGLAARMQRERDILAALNHDHIARLYDAGVDHDGRPYLAIEYVVGEPINAYCRTHALDLAARVRLTVQVARAIAHAHANLIVHRDLKPNNILVSETDGEARVKLLDFGIAKLLGREEGGSASDLTQVLGRALTPDYASPEQMREEPITTASDIYSLGVVLYEVVTGEKPYKLKRQSASALAEAVMNADVTWPSRRVGNNTAANVPVRDARRIEGDLDAIIMKALKAQPEDRYATASALADDLERFLAHQPVLAQPDSWAYRARRFVQRHALATGAGAAVLIALLAGAGLALWQAREARLETAKTQAVKDFLLGIITVGNVDQQDAMARRKQPIGDVLLDAAKTMPQKFADQPEIRAEIQGLLGTAMADLSMNDSARTLREARFAELDSGGASLIERMSAQVDLALTLFMTNEQARSSELLVDAIAKLERVNERAAQKLLATALRALSEAKVQRRAGVSGVPDAARAAGISEQLEPGSKDHIAGLSQLGYAHAAQPKVDTAAVDAAFKNAIELAKQLPPAERAYEATVRFKYAEAQYPMRRSVRAQEELSEGLAIIERTSGSDTFRWAFTAVGLANSLARSGETARAFDMFERVVRAYGNVRGEIDPMFISRARALYASALVDFGRFADSDRISAIGYEPYRGPGKRFPNQLFTPVTRRAQVLLALGDYRQAERVVRDLLEALPAGQVSRQTTELSYAERLLAQTLMHQGKYAEAQKLLKDNVVPGDSPGNRFNSNSNFSRMMLARSYLEQGRLDDARREVGELRGIMDRIEPDEIAYTRAAAAQLESLAGDLKLKASQHDAAAGHFRRAIELMLPRQHADSPHLAAARADLALALASQGKRAEARGLADQARAAFAKHPSVAPHLKQSLAKVDRLLGRV
jgi:serine/threonine-protein kinase